MYPGRDYACARRRPIFHPAPAPTHADRQGLEQLCRYITRRAISNERLSVNRTGQVVLKLRTAWRDGINHRVMEPIEFMQRLAALVPVPPTATAPAHSGDCAHTQDGSAKERIRWAQMLKRVFEIDIERCPHRCGQLKLIAAIEEPVAIARILTHLGLAAQPPRRAPARRVNLLQAARGVKPDWILRGLEEVFGRR